MAGSRRQYPFHLIEPKWQQTWEQQQAFRAFNPGDSVPEGHPFGVRHGLSGKTANAEALPEKFYILDMFPYPSGAGLHVGHPEGYTATDILARYRRACGFNVLHPMGWDSFGLPAEQYAVKTGQHPRVTTEANIANFTRQIKSLGFSYDWSRELATTDVEYFKWTQWIFLKLYNSWFNPVTNKAEPIETLKYPEDLTAQAKRNEYIGGVGAQRSDKQLTELAETGRDVVEYFVREYRDSKRLAYVSEAPVNWCPELGTVLANEEVIDGKSEVGGFPVIRKPMRQWMLRITAYAEKLLADLDTIDWSDSLKEMQRNWIGRSEGAEVDFHISERPEKIRVFTTRPDTLFGATYMVLSPEHSLVPLVTTAGQDKVVKDYKAFASGKSDLERTELAKNKTGVFTGGYAINPVNHEKIPIWIADYVLASYGTGAIMAVPAHDERDFEFARKFDLPIAQVVLEKQPGMKGEGGEDEPILRAFCGDGIAVGSPPAKVKRSDDGSISRVLPDKPPVLNGLPTSEAKTKITDWLEAKGLGKKTINYKLRDWLFSRQRYWGEPFPIVHCPHCGIVASPESELPVRPPDLADYKPTTTGEPPLAKATEWMKVRCPLCGAWAKRETNTMPQWAGSCWYYLRYLDAKNTGAFVGKDAESYWMGTTGRESKVESRDSGKPSTLDPRPSTPGVDLYVGGTEHAVLHLLYARFWHKVLFDLGYVSTPEPFFKLVNQGLILGEMEFTRFAHENGKLVSAAKVKDITEEATPAGPRLVGIHKETGDKVFGQRIGADAVEAKTHGMVLRTDSQIVVDGRCSKMSKSRGNVVNPDDILKEFGADAFRLYEMFMGPLEMSKPWSTKGVEGVYRFLGRVWRLFVDEQSEVEFEQAETTADASKQGELLNLIKLHAAIKDLPPTPAQLKTLHACIKKVTEDLDGMRFNTAISAMMVFINDAMTWETKPVSVLKTFLQLLAPFAPHLAEELWSKVSCLKSNVPADTSASPTSDFRPQTLDSLAYAPWPKFDPALLVESEIEIPVSVNGKMRDVIKVAVDADNATIEALAKSSEKVKQFMEGKTIKKIIIVPKKMVNIVVA